MNQLQQISPRMNRHVKRGTCKAIRILSGERPGLLAGCDSGGFGEEGAELYARNINFIEEEIKIHDELRPTLATPTRCGLISEPLVLRDYGKPSGIPTLVDAPHAGHTAMIADYHNGQSLIETLLAHGINHVGMTDWKSATEDMKDLEIDNYLAEVIVGMSRSLLK